jgi:hypothetical protein
MFHTQDSSVPILTPFLDPLIEVTERVRTWFADPVILTMLTQQNIIPPQIGVTSYNAREQQLNQGVGQANRIVFMPGSWPDGSNQGVLVAPLRRKGVYERVNATWERIVTASVWAVDSSDAASTANQEKQIQAVSSLLNTLHTALRDVLQGDFPGIGEIFRDPKVGSGNQAFGMELLFQFMFRCEMRGLPVNVSGVPVTPVINS